MDIQIRPVTDGNRDHCLSLSLSEEQSGFVPDVASSLAMASRYPDACPLAITTRDGLVVGFCLYGIDDSSGRWKIFRMVIDQSHQGMGYGTAATRLVMDRLRSQHGASEVLIVFHEDNEVARHVYSRLGFEVYDRIGSKMLARAFLPLPASSVR